MSWTDEDDSFEDVKSKKVHRKPRKPFERMTDEETDQNEEDPDYKRKRAGKRSHRKKTHKDDFWEGDQR